MKKLKLISYLFILVGSLSITSCSTDVEPIDPAVILNPGPDPTNPTTGFFKVDFNNQTYNATVATAFVMGNTIIISGARGVQGENFSFILDGSTVKTYNSAEDNMVYNPSNASEYDYANFADMSTPVNTGSVTITEINQTTHMISGTFNFVGYWSDYTDENPPAPIAFTNGSFSIPYTSTNPTSDIFTAQVDGVSFVPALTASSFISINDQDWISLSGGDEQNTESLTVSFKDGIAAGTYTITGDVANDVVQGIYSKDDIDFKASTGSVNITSITATHIKGNFSFTGSNTAGDSVIITNGVVDMEY